MPKFSAAAIDQIVLRASDRRGEMRVELRGQLAGILNAVLGQNKTVTSGEDVAVEVSFLVAGRGIEPLTFR